MVLAFAFMLVLTAPPSPWTEVARTPSLTVYKRPHHDGVLTEWMATGLVQAPPWVVKNALDDYEPKTGQMPYMAEIKVLKRDARGTLIYNRTAPPFVDDRDYTIRMFDDSFVEPDGDVVYVARWVTANHEGPPPREGVVRVDKTEGYWRLDPVDGGKRTKATYFVVASPGGNIPQSIADMGTNTVMADVFAALRTRVKAKEYAVTPPLAPTRRKP